MNAILDLLKMGCKIIFPDGRYLMGEPDTGYITFGNEFGTMGVYSLDVGGLRQVLEDKDFNRREGS